jgi:hypothetical protein
MVFNQAQPVGTPPIEKTAVKGEPEMIKVKCDMHPWMTAYVLISSHPFFSVTGADGRFKLDKVPAGKYTVEAWHEKFGAKTMEVTVEPDQAAAADFAYTGTEQG